MQIGVKIANYGPDGGGAVAEAVAAESAGFDSVWVTDRLLTLDDQESAYPYSGDGSIPWTPTTPFHEPLVVLSAVAAVTERVRLGTGVLVLPLREPHLLAKQAATLAALSGGRLVLGIGVGWMREEFLVLGHDFDRRHHDTRSAIDLLRRAWTGRIGPATDVADGPDLHMHPVPPGPIPVLMGGNSTTALRLGGGSADGWYGLFHNGSIDLDQVRSKVGFLRGGSLTAPAPAVILRIGGPWEQTLPHLKALARLGVTEVVVDCDLSDGDGAAAARAALGAAVADVPAPA